MEKENGLTVEILNSGLNDLGGGEQAVAAREVALFVHGKLPDPEQIEDYEVILSRGEAAEGGGFSAAVSEVLATFTFSADEL